MPKNMRNVVIGVGGVVGLILLVTLYGLVTNPSGVAKVFGDIVAIYFPEPPVVVAVAPPAPPRPAAPIVPATNGPTAAVVAVTHPATPGPVPAPTAQVVAHPPTPALPPAPATNAAPASATPAPEPAATPSAPEVYSPGITAWTPPQIMPAQPNWTWETPDGRTYQNVAVTKIDPETVSISHSMGVAHIDIASLPPEVQKKLGYDPVAALAYKKELQREREHPYYDFENFAEAKAAAKQMNWPLAWICTDPSMLTAPNPAPHSEADASQMAMKALQSRSIIVLLKGDPDLLRIPANLLNGQFFQFDEGVIPGGHHFLLPKVVITNPEGTKAYGRVTYAQMKASGEVEIDKILDAIQPPKP